MQTVAYGSFSDTLHRAVRAAHVPLNGTIEVTRRCPLACGHCYNNLPMSDRGAQLQELTCDEHRKLLDEIVEAGCLWLLYTGGEIFARRDFLDIYTHAKRNGLVVTLYTNGTLITPIVADHLATWPPFALEITLYGRTRETYEKLTGVPGSYDRCMRGIELALDRGLPLSLKTVVVGINKHEVWDMQRFAEHELGVDFRFDSMMNPRLDCSQSPLAMRLAPEECVEFDLQDEACSAAWQKFAQRFCGPVHTPETEGQLYHCGAGVDSFSINPYGRMSLCALSQQDLYDVRLGTFREGWEHFLRGVRLKPSARVTKCTACELKAMCGMCPANGELENQDPESPVDFLCRVAHIRAHAYGFPIAPHGSCEYCKGGDRHDELMRAVASLNRNKPAEQSLDGHTPLPLTVAPGSTSDEGCSTSGCAPCRR